MTKAQVLEFTSAFPPAEKLTETLLNIDYAKHAETLRRLALTVAAFIVAFVTFAREKWVEHDMTERVQVTLLQVQEQTKKFVEFVKEMKEANATLV